jgi:platelet-activating factor acetylhydrolase IB subunit alpha
MDKNKDNEINKSILEWLVTKNLNSVIEPFMNETNLKLDDATKNNFLEKKWSTILVMQKKIIDLENQIKQLKEDIDKQGSSGGGLAGNKVNESMV